jgi:segregation and condensation protein B
MAYLPPVTRGEISKQTGREISRDIIAALKRYGRIDGAMRAPQAGAPFAYVTTRKFLEVFGFASPRDLPDLERLKAEGQMQRGQGRPTSTARSGSRTKATRLRARRKSSIRPRTSKNI